MNDYRKILDINVTALEHPAAVETLDGCFSTGTSRKIAFANANLLNIAHGDAHLRQALHDFIIFNDGIGTDLASRWLYGRSFPANLNGTDFTTDYLNATRHRYRIFLLGARPGIVEKAAVVLNQLCPRHSIVGMTHGFHPPSATAEVVEQIRLAQADLVLVGMGNPRQELWLADNLQATGCRLGFAIGALFDFLAGEFRRAPALVRSLRCEWLYRLALEPKRLARRYLVGNFLFLWRVGRQKIAKLR